MIWLLLVRMLGAAAVAGLALSAFTPAVPLLASRLIPSRPPEHAEAIVVLGAGGIAPGGGLTDTSLRAAVAGVGLFQQGWAPLLVFSGGAGYQRQPEAAARADLARRSGVPAAAIVTAVPARTTREEALHLWALLEPRGVRKILLVVDGPGATRATGAFERVGFEVVPAPWSGPADLDATPENRLSLLRDVAMEAIARLYYRAMGYG